MPQKFLTFNPILEMYSSVDDLVNKDDVEILASMPPPDLPLRNQWSVWEQLETEAQKDYTSSMKLIATFKSVQGFWELLGSLPQPSQLMVDQRMVRKLEEGQHQLVDAIMIFRDGIKPMWEDPLNAVGGHFELRYPRTSDLEEQAKVDEHWNKIVLCMIGCTFEMCEMITGVRLVDKLHTAGRSNGNLRIEIWYTEKNAKPNGRFILKDSIEKMVFKKQGFHRDTSVGPLVTKSHRKR